MIKIAMTSFLMTIAVANTTHAFDDPAIAVCEYAWIHEQHAPVGSFERKTAVISGQDVTLTLDYSPININPQSIIYNCHYDLNILGQIILNQPKMVRENEAPINSWSELLEPLMDMGIYPIERKNTALQIK